MTTKLLLLAAAGVAALAGGLLYAWTTASTASSPARVSSANASAPPPAAGPSQRDESRMGEPTQHRLEEATFAGGCFWCMEEAFEEEDGVLSVTSGYTGGSVKAPSYEQVSAGATGHFEAIRVVYDPAKIGYARLLDVFWRNVDPTDAGGQFCDRGPQYRAAIFYHDAEQRRLAEASKKALEESHRLGKPVVTDVLAQSEFYPAEEYHQGYYSKNPIRYKFYKTSCGRERTLKRVWGTEAGD